MKYIPEVFVLAVLVTLSFFIVWDKAFGKELTKPQKLGELSFQLVNAIDMFQTLEIVEHGDLYYETNPILGKHPQKYEVITYFMLRGAFHYEITKWLPEKLKMPWLTITFFPQLPIIEHNHNLGIRIGW